MNSDATNTAVVPIALPGRDHATLAMLPFSVAGSEPRNEPVAVAYQLEVDGQIRRVNVTLRPSGGLTLPSPSDQLVFLALLQLGLKDDPPKERLGFQRQQVIDLLGWTGGGRNYDRLREALDRLAGVMITVDSALVSRDGREYSKAASAAHIIDAHEVRSGRGADCWVRWGHLVREAFRLGDFKRLDWDLVLALGNPVTAQLYRLVDRVTLSGEPQWAVGWQPLAKALGLSQNYARPALFRRRLEPHTNKLVEVGVLDSVDYQRGGVFVFHVRNYLRTQLRRVLTDELGVFPDAARQLVAGFDETLIMQQADCLRFRQPPPREPAGYLVKAVREGYELRYPEDEPAAFAALWSMYGPLEREAYHRAGVSLLGTGDSLFDSHADPQAWTVELRSVVRFLLTWGLEPDELDRSGAAIRRAGTPTGYA